MAFDYFHDNSKHEDARYTLLFVGLRLKAIMKTRKKWYGNNPKFKLRLLKKKNTCWSRVYGDFHKPMIIAWNKSTKCMIKCETISRENLKDVSGDKIPPFIPITHIVFLLWKQPMNMP